MKRERWLNGLGRKTSECRGSVQRQRRLSFEPLEPRELLAGNVGAVVRSGSLTLIGDDLDNIFSVIGTTVAGQYAITGLNGTRINGQAGVTVNGITTNVVATLGAGNDHFKLGNANLRGDVSASGDVGVDTIDITDSIIGDDVNITTGLNDNNFGPTSTPVEVVMIERTRIRDVLYMQGGTLAETFLLKQVEVGGNAQIQTANGHDGIGLIDSIFAQSVTVQLGNGSDIASIEGSTFNGRATFEAKTGNNDQLTIDVLAHNTFSVAPTFVSFERTHPLVEDIDWSYSGSNGPAFWGRLTPAFIRASAGIAQSPINIVTSQTQRSNLPNLALNYGTQTNLDYVHNGHAIEVQFDPGNTVTVDGAHYVLERMQFHFPSEHTVNGAAFAGELHLVHRNAATGKVVVLAVLVNVNNSLADRDYAPLAANPPTVSNPNKVLVSLNPNSLLPTDRRFYRYSGSLTTPPASEIVEWHVFTTPINISQTQKNALAAAIGFANNRPVRPLNTRIVWQDTT